MTDSYMAEVSNHYVMVYSITLAVIIMLTSLFQTYFIKKLFTTGPMPGTKEFKPRA
jgi:hypothetical protein